MKLSARNQFQGKVKSVKLGNVMAEVVVDIGGGHEIVSAITRASAEDLALSPGTTRGLARRLFEASEISSRASATASGIILWASTKPLSRTTLARIAEAIPATAIVFVMSSLIGNISPSESDCRSRSRT